MERFRTICAIAVLLALAGFSSGCRKQPKPTSPVDPDGKVEVVLPEHGAYSGAYIDFGEAEDIGDRVIWAEPRLFRADIAR